MLIKNTILDLLFPPQCLGCGELDTWLCSDCRSVIQLNPNQTCYRCERESLCGQTCSRCFEINPLALDRVLITAHYEGNPLLKRAIHALKYAGQGKVARSLVPLLEETLIKHAADLNGPLIILPVPLHRDDERERGFNQAELLSRLSLPATVSMSYQPWLMTKRIKTQKQVKTHSRDERFTNVKETFVLRSQPDPNAVYLLVDDVMSSGATLEACCYTLKRAGAKTVWGLTLARN